MRIAAAIRTSNMSRPLLHQAITQKYSLHYTLQQHDYRVCITASNHTKSLTCLLHPATTQTLSLLLPNVFSSFFASDNEWGMRARLGQANPLIGYESDGMHSRHRFLVSGTGGLRSSTLPGDDRDSPYLGGWYRVSMLDLMYKYIRLIYSTLSSQTW